MAYTNEQSYATLVDGRVFEPGESDEPAKKSKKKAAAAVEPDGGDEPDDGDTVAADESKED